MPVTRSVVPKYSCWFWDICVNVKGLSWANGKVSMKKLLLKMLWESHMTSSSQDSVWYYSKNHQSNLKNSILILYLWIIMYKKSFYTKNQFFYIGSLQGRNNFISVQSTDTKKNKIKYSAIIHADCTSEKG